MNVVVEELAPCRKKLKVDVQAERVDEALKHVVDDFQKHAKIPGFRPGKAPRAMIEKRFASEIDDELRRTFVPRIFREVVAQEKLHVVGSPRIEELKFEKGAPLSFSTVVEFIPAFDLPDYRSMRLTSQELGQVTDADVDEALQRLATAHADYKDIEGRSAQEGDFAVIDFTSTCEGKPLLEIAPAAKNLAQNQNLWMWLKPDVFLPGFCAQLYGMQLEEQKQVEVELPSDFEIEPLRGKKVVFSVTLRKLKERVLPPLDETFAHERFKVSLNELRAGLRQDLEAQRERVRRRNLAGELMQKLEEAVKCELPDTLVQQQTQHVIYDIVRENQSRNVPDSMLEERRDEIFKSAGQQARARVKTGIILSRIAKEENLQVTEQEMNDQMTWMANEHNMSPAQLVAQLDKANALGQVERDLLNQKTMDYLIEMMTKTA